MKVVIFFFYFFPLWHLAEAFRKELLGLVTLSRNNSRPTKLKCSSSRVDIKSSLIRPRENHFLGEPGGGQHWWLPSPHQPLQLCVALS